MATETRLEQREPGRFFRILLVLAGIVAGQLILYGPSLTGRKVLLPLDFLAGQEMYLPRSPEIKAIEPKDISVLDMALLFEPMRRFAVSEFRSGRLPQWAPYAYAGAPLNWPVLSPFWALKCSSESPRVLAWSQLLMALVAGVGAYLFFRGALRVSFWPAAICAWCYPLTGFFVFWQGFPAVEVVCWLPWLLLAVERTVMGTSRFAPIGLAAVTALVLSGQLDLAGQALLVSGLYGLWRLFEYHFVPGIKSPERGSIAETIKATLRTPGETLWRARRAIVCLTAGWILGFLLVTPYFVPLLEYSQTGARMTKRASGAEERPPVGWKALPQTVLPDMYGTRQVGSTRYAGGFVQQESSAAGYAGLMATLFAAPLALLSARHRRQILLWTLLSFLALSWNLNVPGVVTLLRLPGLNMMSHNRLVFVACFAILALAAIGLDVLLKEGVKWRRWMWVPVALLTVLFTWCLYRTMALPEAAATRVPALVAAGKAVDWMRDLEAVARMQAWFRHYYAVAALWCGLGLLGWILLWRRRVQQRVLFLIMGVFLASELLWFGYGRNVQSDPGLYYPSIPVLESVAKAPPGRVIGFGCLPAPLAAICGLCDIRGYDGVEPARMVELLETAADPLSNKPRYAVTMQMAPKATITSEGDIQLRPVLDMLGVRYVIFRGAPFGKTRPLFQGFDYWVLQNPRALPRVFVPGRVELETNHTARVQKIAAPEFQPRAVAYVETPVNLPDACIGTAELIEETPTRMTISMDMKTAGLVVVADHWTEGWKAYLGEKQMPVLQANHAVRGIVVPPGAGTLQLRYEPGSFALGLWLASASAAIMIGWLVLGMAFRGKAKSNASHDRSPGQPQTAAAG